MRWIGGLDWVCPSVRLHRSSAIGTIILLYCTVLFLACLTNPGAVRAVYIQPQTTATTTCRRHNHASRAEQDHHEPILAPSPDRSLCDKQHTFPLEVLNNTRTQSSPIPPETTRDPLRWRDISGLGFPLRHPQLNHFRIHPRLLNRGAYIIPSPAPSSLSGTATRRFVHTDGADRT